MTHEERFERIEQKIEFVVNQQAQFSIDLQQMQGVLQKQTDHLNAAMVAAFGMLGKLSEAQALTEANLQGLQVQMQKLEEKGAETEERLNLFINFVERHLSERNSKKRRKK